MRRFPSRAFVDTSFFYACFDPDDENHARARLVLEALKERRSALHTTWDVVSETITLLRYRQDHRAALRFLDEVKPLLLIAPYGDRVRQEAEEVFRKFGVDRRLSFCDAVSFVVVTGLLRGLPCLSFDRDFRALGLTAIP